jgi:hypothetical protein
MGYFGMKACMEVDSDLGTVHRVVGTAASVPGMRGGKRKELPKAREPPLSTSSRTARFRLDRGHFTPLRRPEPS